MWLRELLVFLLCSSAVWAEVARIEIHARSNVLDGRAFGLAGHYEKLVGKVFFTVGTTPAFERPVISLDVATGIRTVIVPPPVDPRSLVYDPIRDRLLVFDILAGTQLLAVDPDTLQGTGVSGPGVGSPSSVP